MCNDTLREISHSIIVNLSAQQRRANGTLQQHHYLPVITPPLASSM